MIPHICTAFSPKDAVFVSQATRGIHIGGGGLLFSISLIAILRTLNTKHVFNPQIAVNPFTGQNMHVHIAQPQYADYYCRSQFGKRYDL